MAIADKDDSRDCFQAAEEQFGPAGSWDLNALSYQVMFSVASSQLGCGQGVVVDCPLSKVELYKQAKLLAQQVFAAFYKHDQRLVLLAVLHEYTNMRPGEIEINFAGG